MLRKTVTDSRSTSGAVGASMRPQRNAAENGGLSRYDGAYDVASMRPQRNAAENGCQQQSRPRIRVLQ